VIYGAPTPPPTTKMLQLSQYFCSEQTYSISDLQLKIVGFEVGAVAGVS